MTRPVTLFTGQWADLPLETVAKKAKEFGFDGLEQVIVAMRKGFLFMSSISDGSCLGVVASKGCDIGLVGYQTTLLVERAGSVLTPDLVRELKQEMLAS